MRKAVGVLIVVLSMAAGMYLLDWQMQTLHPIQDSPKLKFEMTFLGDQILSSKWPGDGLVVGGLSGLAWSSLNKIIYAISDDRGRNGASRFYELKLSFLENNKPELNISGVHLLRTENGKTFPDRSLDPEGIAVDRRGWIYVSSEGDLEAKTLAPPVILQLDQKGQVKRRSHFQAPFFDIEKVGEYGIRYNMAFESLDILEPERILVTTTETALYQDGPLASLNEGTVVRIASYSMDREGELTPLHQKVYPLSKLPARREVSRSVMGVPDILILKPDEYLVLERAYLADRAKLRVKLFYADCRPATEVQALPSLQNQTYEPCQKKDLYDFDLLIGKLNEIHPVIDNIEGMTWGPELEGGGRLLIFISDNNFRTEQKTQILFFRVESSFF